MKSMFASYYKTFLENKQFIFIEVTYCEKKETSSKYFLNTFYEITNECK